MSAASPSEAILRRKRQSTDSLRTEAGPDWRAYGLPLFALACWVLAIRHLAPEWTANEQYHFGWLVPLLAAYLVKVRFENCPPPGPVPSRGLVTGAVLLLAFAGVLIMPIREANLDWRLVEWWLVGVAIAASYVCFWQIGGISWARHFSFPILFFLIAVPLPRNLEYPWMERLMYSNATVSAELLHWLGLDAQARGNLIQLPNCTLGVEEACSGIRSLQSTLMLSLFLGELLGLKWFWRLGLVGAGLGWALVTNIGRTVTLGLIGAQGGLPAVDAWHDRVGFAVLALCSATVIVTAWLIHRLTAGRLDFQSSGTNAAPKVWQEFRPVALPSAVGFAMLGVGLGLNHVWFAIHDRDLAPATPWSFRLPADQPGFRDIAIAQRTRSLLHFDEGYSGAWRDGSGSRWQAFYFHWEPGRNAAQTSRMHDPRSCLASTGMVPVAVLPSVEFAQKDVVLSFDAYHFLDGQRDLFVFNCVAEDVRTSDGRRRAREDNSPTDRIAAALAGRRQEGQRRLEAAVWGAPDAATATRQFAELLRQQLIVASGR
jgi:exosortase